MNAELVNSKIYALESKVSSLEKAKEALESDLKALKKSSEAAIESAKESLSNASANKPAQRTEKVEDKETNQESEDFIDISSRLTVIGRINDQYMVRHDGVAKSLPSKELNILKAAITKQMRLERDAMRLSEVPPPAAGGLSGALPPPLLPSTMAGPPSGLPAPGGASASAQSPVKPLTSEPVTGRAPSARSAEKGEVAPGSRSDRSSGYRERSDKDSPSSGYRANDSASGADSSNRGSYR